MTFQLEVSEQALERSIRVVVLRGRLDRTTSPRLACSLTSALAERPGRIVVDLIDLTSLDASGVAVLRDSQARLADANGCLAFVGEGPCHAQLSAVTPDGPILAVFHTRAEALAAIRRDVAVRRPCAVRSLRDIPAG
jgi:anti-sigma B factor antagonist